MILNSDDRKLLTYLHAVKVATYKQIHRDIYTSYKFRSACNRVIKLRHLGLLTGWEDRLNLVGGKVLSLSKKGFSNYVAIGEEKRVELKSDAVEHDIYLVDLRLVFMNIPNVKNYYTENQIQTWWIGSSDSFKNTAAQLRSDAICNIIIGNESIYAGVEYEASSKSAARYENIVRKYYSSSEISLVLFVCLCSEQMNKIQKIEREIVKDKYPKIFYQLKQNVMVNTPLHFNNFNDRSLRFDTKTSSDLLVTT